MHHAYDVVNDPSQTPAPADRLFRRKQQGVPPTAWLIHD
jgi:hypothetical protein